MNISPTPTDLNQWMWAFLGGMPTPGTIPRGGVRGFKRETGWDIKKGKGTKGATLTLKDEPPCEGTLTLQLIGPGGFYAWGGRSTDFAQWDNFVSQILSTTPDKQKAQGITVSYPAFASIGLTVVVIKDYSPLEHVGKGLYQSTLQLIEWSSPPPTSIVSTVSSKKSDGSGTGGTKPPNPQTIAQQIQIGALQAAIAAAGDAMSYFASVNGLPIVAGTLLIPAVGAWTADVHLATDAPVTGAASVVIGNLTLTGTVYRSEAYGGQVRARIVGGAGGWRKAVPAQGYGSSSGIKLSTVLEDVARACGETVAVPNDPTIGNAFARVAFAASVASDVLWQLVTQGAIPAWYIDATGKTQASSWPASTVTSPFTVADQKPDEGIVVVATEDYVSWMPGASFTAPQLAGTLTAAGVHYVWDNDGKFRFEVLTGGAQDRVLGPIQQLMQKELAPTRFYGRYEYTTSNPSASTVDAEPTDSNLGLPDLQAVPITADSIAGFTPAAGCTCHIQFVNGLPTKPVCVWIDQTPTKAQILSGEQPVARLGDQVQSFLPPGLPVMGTVSGNPFTGIITVANPITGVITGGSTQVSSA